MKSLNNKPIVLFLFILQLLIGVSTNAQEKITLQEAFEMAIANNFQIKQSKNTLQISENNLSRGNAGQLPSVNASGAVDLGRDNTKIQFQNNPETVEVNWAESTNWNANIAADYTLFNGFRNKYTYDKLSESLDLSQAQARLEIEGILLQLATAYYNVLRTKDNLGMLDSNLAISSDRLKLAELSQQYSGGDKLSVLAAEVDFNQDSVEYINASLAMDNARIDLNYLLGLELAALTVADERIDPEKVMMLETLREKMQAQNAEYLMQQKGAQISMLDYKISRTAYAPNLNLGASYSYNNNQSEGSFLALNQSDGLGLQLSLSVPIFNGGRNKTTEKKSKLLMENQLLAKEELKIRLERDLQKAYRNYTTALKTLELELLNIKTAQTNFMYSEELYKNGNVSSIVFREAQVNLLLAQNNLNNLRFNLRLAELELYRLSGQLLPE